MKYLLTISILLVSTFLMGQEELHTRRARHIDAYNEAKSLVGVGNFFKSAEILTEVLSKDESFDEAIMLLHEVYIKRDEPQNANAVLSKYMSELEPQFLNRLFVIQANYSYQMGEYDEAKNLINNVNDEVFDISSTQVEFLHQSIEFSIAQSSNPLNIDFEKLPYPINQFSMQYFPSITRAGQLVYTMRDQLGRGDEDLVTTRWQKNKWEKPMPLSFNINTDRNEGTASISADGNTLVFTSCNRPGNIGSCDLYITYLINGEWTEPELLNEEVNSPEWDSQPSLSADGSTLYFVSMRSGGIGKQDIWMTKKVKGTWERAKNLGPEVNTSEDDCSPFIYLDNETLIFATKGRIGLGGYDLFKTVKANSGWSVPSNLGYPINNSFDQIGYCIAADQWAYFSSSDSTGRITLQRFKVPSALVPSLEQPQFTGKVVDALTQEPISAELELIFGDDIRRLSAGDDGLFSIATDEFNVIKARKRGYLKENVKINEFLKDSTVQLTPFKIGDRLESSPILFDFDNSKLTDDALLALEPVLEMLKEYPELSVEVRGYTDTSGDELYNQMLSERRAKTVSIYLVKKLDIANRITAQGLGQIQAVKGGTKSESLSLSRRVEIIIIEIDR